ncbi:MAG: formate dehydrogenase accessory sulfurtransferase FdhD [Spirochaetota bacterium]|nr:formate dehydrogenase accessory sulfurtransferase FdhD [Spirochaetota bacterium]
MSDQVDFGPSIDLDIIRIKQGKAIPDKQCVATEVPLTIITNGDEIVTMLCTPSHLKELTIGFLYSSSFINSFDDIKSYTLDSTRWAAYCELKKKLNPDIIHKRLYTSGCGKGVMYTNMNEISSRHPLQNDITISHDEIIEIARWLQHCSILYRSTGGVHTAALSEKGSIPGIHIDDIGRHNSVDKVIGKGLMEGIDFSRTALISTGRISSEILHKARRSGIAITISRGAPTHQTILLAREMAITVVGFARGGGFSIYSKEDRIRL